MTRQTHVRRFWNPDDDEIWIDVERIDKLITTSGQGPTYQKRTYNLHWYDEERHDNPTRVSETVRVTSPVRPEQWVDLPTAFKLTTIEHGRKASWQKTTFMQRNAGGASTRKRTVRRVHQRKTATEPDADGFFESYELIEGSAEPIYWLDVELIDDWHNRTGQGPDYQANTPRLDQDYLKDWFPEAPQPLSGPPVRLDPWQNIVNVHWAPPMALNILFLVTMTSWMQDSPAVACSPVTAPHPGPPAPIQNYTPYVTYELRGETLDPASGFVLEGAPRLSPSSLSLGSWNYFDCVFVERAASDVAPDAVLSFDVRANNVMQLGTQCYGQFPPLTPEQLGVTNLGLVVGADAPLEPLMVLTSGVRLTRDGEPWRLDHISIGEITPGTGRSIGLTFHFLPE